MKIILSLGLFVSLFALFVLSSRAIAGNNQRFYISVYKGVHHCSKNYGTIAVKEQPINQSVIDKLSQIGLPYFTPLTLSRHTASRTGCFTLIANEPRASFLLQAEVLPPIIQSPVDSVVLTTVTDITLLYEFQVKLTIVDLKTGKTLASAIGVGNTDDFVMGVDLIEGIRGRINGSEKTKEMKVIATSFVDAFNQLVPFIETMPIKF